MTRLRWRWPGPVQALAPRMDGATGRLLLARVLEQGAFGLASLILAARLGPESYAPLGALLIVNSASILLSDFGIGIQIMSKGAEAVAPKAVWLMRVGDSALALLGLLIGVGVGGQVGAVVGLSGVLWLLSAEAYVRKAAGIARGEITRVAVSEALGAGIFFCIALAGVAQPDAAVVLAGCGMAAKHLVEILVSHPLGALAGADASRTSGREFGHVWASQLMSFGSANVDFVLLGLLGSPSVFSLYSLGFRLVSLAPSQFSYAAQRVMLVEMGMANPPDRRESHYRRRTRQLFGIGLGAAAATVVLAPVLPIVLGDAWRLLPGVVVVLACALPSRMVGGVAGSAILGSGGSSSLSRFELVRLVVTTLVLLAAVGHGLWVFSFASAAVAIAAYLSIHRVAGWVVGLTTPRWLAGWSVVAVALAGGTAWAASAFWGTP